MAPGLPLMNKFQQLSPPNFHGKSTGDGYVAFEKSRRFSLRGAGGLLRLHLRDLPGLPERRWGGPPRGQRSAERARAAELVADSATRWQGWDILGVKLLDKI